MILMLDAALNILAEPSILVLLLANKIVVLLQRKSFLQIKLYIFEWVDGEEGTLKLSLEFLFFAI